MDSRLEKITENNKVFLVYKINAEDSIDQMSVNMLKNNAIQHILPVSFTQIGEEQYIRYDITSKISLSQVIKYPISKERFLAIFEGIFDGILNLDDYMVPNNTLLLDIDDIYFDEFNECSYLVAFPVNIPSSQNIDFAEFTRSLINRVQLQANDEFITGKVLNHLNQTQIFSIVEFKNFIKSIHNEKNVKQNPTIVKQPVQQQVTPQPQPPAQSHLLSNQQNGITNNPPQKPQIQKPVPSQQKSVNIPGKQNVPINIPGQNPSGKPILNQANRPMPQTATDSNEPKISLLYLLQHYNSENAALYKKQKEAKKGKGKKAEVKNMPQNISIPRKQQNPAITQQAPNPVPYVEQREPQKRNFGDTTVLHAARGPINNNGETTVLSSETTVLNASANPSQMIAPHLIRKKNNEKISINKPVFRVGKERSYVDYFIGDNTAISRSHADFIIRDGKYYIVDKNSTNHTFVNGIMIQSNVETAITHGDIIRLANEDFEFRLY